LIIIIIIIIGNENHTRIIKRKHARKARSAAYSHWSQYIMQKNTINSTIKQRTGHMMV